MIIYFTEVICILIKNVNHSSCHCIMQKNSLSALKCNKLWWQGSYGLSENTWRTILYLFMFLRRVQPHIVFCCSRFFQTHTLRRLVVPGCSRMWLSQVFCFLLLLCFLCKIQRHDGINAWSYLLPLHHVINYSVMSRHTLGVCEQCHAVPAYVCNKNKAVEKIVGQKMRHRGTLFLS